MCRFRGFAGLVGMSLVVGCYSPNIPQGAFTCGPGGACPASYHCAADNRCYSVADASIDAVCTSATTVQPTCSVSPATGQACYPGCQTGCGGCGWCSVVKGTATCLQGTAGTKDLGQICDPTLASDCKAGLYCQPECASGRCYQPCDANTNNCPQSSSCSQAATTTAGKALPFKLCSLVAACDPISQTSPTCPSPFACYPVGSGAQTKCDCAGSTPAGQRCFLLDECQAGYSCNGPAGATTCQQTCTAGSTCSAGSCTVVAGSTYGFCM